MTTLLAERIEDFIELTISKFDKGRWLDLSLEHQEYVSASLLTEKNINMSGSAIIDFKIQKKNTGNAKLSGLFAQDSTAVEDVMTSGQVNWAMTTTSWAYDIYEDAFQSEPETIIKLLKIREHDALNSLAELHEELLWSAPTSPSENGVYGIPFWLQKNATEGFFGGNPLGFAGGAAGVDSNTLPRWRNWTFSYDRVSIDDMVRKFKRSLAWTHFKPPVPHPELGYGAAKYSGYTTYRVIEEMERLAESRNDNLGKDLAMYLGQVTIGGVPVKWVPYLEANDTTDPIYGINWKTIRPFVKAGAFMKRHPPKQAPRQRNVREVHIDSWWNMICQNRRANFCGYRA